MKNYESKTMSQVIWSGFLRGIRNYFALSGVLWQWFRQRSNKR